MTPFSVVVGLTFCHFLQDVVLTRVLDDAIVANLNSVIHANNAIVSFSYKCYNIYDIVNMHPNFFVLLNCIFSRLFHCWRTIVLLFKNYLQGLGHLLHLWNPRKIWYFLPSRGICYFVLSLSFFVFVNNIYIRYFGWNLLGVRDFIGISFLSSMLRWSTCDNR